MTPKGAEGNDLNAKTRENSSLNTQRNAEKKHKNSPKRLKVQNDGWRMVIELVTGMILGVSLGLTLGKENMLSEQILASLVL